MIMIIDFFKSQLDYVYFFYGLSFFALAAVCVTIKKIDKSGIKWHWLELFAAFHGANEWLDMIAVSFGDNPSFSLVRLAVMVVSFLFLLQFGLSGIEALYNKKYAGFIYPPLLASFAAGVYLSGGAAANIAGRYCFGFTGGILSAASLYALSFKIQLPGGNLKKSAFFFFLYAIASGLIVPAAEFFPASVINAESFFSFFKTPPQLIRGLCALLIANYIFGYSRQLRSHRNFGQIAGKNNITGINLTLLISLILSGWLLTNFLETVALKEIAADSDSSVKIISGAINEKLSSIKKSALILAAQKEIRDELISGGGPFTKSNETADFFSQSLGGALVYIINSSGITVASSNRGAPDSLIGHNYKFRKYFQDAAGGKIGEDLNKGITTNKRGHYVCAPVKGEDGKIIGAAAIKSEVEDIEKNFKAYQNCFFISSDGIIFISSISDLLFTPMWPLAPEKLDAINASRKFGAVKNAALLKKEISKAQTAELHGMKFYVNRSNFSPGWDIALFSSYKKAAVFRLFGITISCVVFILILNFFVWIQLLNESAFGIYLEKERLATILKSIGEGVIVVGNDLKILMINETAKKMLETEGGKFENSNLFDVFIVKDQKTGEKLESCSLKALSERQTIDFGRNAVLTGASGEKKFIMATAAPVIAEDQSAIGAVIAFKDITNIKKMDEELLHMNQIKSIGTLAGGIAHDFNNLLLAINCNIELMRRYFNDREKFESSLSRISEAVFKAKNITAQFITFARGGKPLKKTADPASILKKIISFTLVGTKIAYEFQFENALRLIDADEAQLNQAFSNIAINACHAMPEGGMLKVAAENVYIDEETADGQRFTGDFVKISFTDTGCGITPEDITQIFNPYFTTKSTGMGLGLTSVYSIVKNHGGFIKVSSTIGIGARFELFFPATATQLEKTKIKAAASENLSQKPEGFKNDYRVLLMDDEPLIRQTAVQLLNHIGFKAECACDGNEAIELYRKSIIEKAPYDILIMDLTVPGGMGGVETIKILKRIDPEVTAIASSGYFDNSSISNYRSEGFAGYIAKPYKIHDLNMLIKKIIKEKSNQLNKKRME